MFKRTHPRAPWAAMPWRGVDLSSENARRKDAFLRCAKAAVEAARRARAPVLVGVRKEIPVDTDHTMWLGGVRLIWRVNVGARPPT